MRPTLFQHLVSFDDARRLTIEAARPIVRTEHAALEQLDGRVAAEDVTCAHDVPPFDRAAMDGYAVVADDTQGASAAAPATLQVAGTVYTGHTWGRVLQPGECVEIATGAPIPIGATAVVMVEHTSRERDRVLVRQPVTTGQNIGRRGADMRAGTQVLASGSVMTPGRVGVVAGAGLTGLRVYARPSVAIISTGNELVRPGAPLGTGQVHNINQFTVAAVVRRHGGIAAPLPIASDTLDALDRAVDAILAHDLAVFSGGSSVGSRDLMADVIARRGDIIYHGIAVKPGKPTLLARVGGTVVMGLPGYPTSCLSNAYLLLVPLLRATARLPRWTPDVVRLPLARAVTSTADRHQFYTVKIVEGRAEPVFKGSGDITSMANADGYFEIPIGVDGMAEGTEVGVTRFDLY